MGAFFGCLVVAIVFLICVGEGIEPALVKIANQFERIADALENKGHDNEAAREEK